MIGAHRRPRGCLGSLFCTVTQESSDSNVGANGVASSRRDISTRIRSSRFVVMRATPPAASWRPIVGAPPCAAMSPTGGDVRRRQIRPVGEEHDSTLAHRQMQQRGDHVTVDCCVVHRLAHCGAEFALQPAGRVAPLPEGLVQHHPVQVGARLLSTSAQRGAAKALTTAVASKSSALDGPTSAEQKRNQFVGVLAVHVGVTGHGHHACNPATPRPPPTILACPRLSARLSRFGKRYLEGGKRHAPCRTSPPRSA